MPDTDLGGAEAASSVADPLELLQTQTIENAAVRAVLCTRDEELVVDEEASDQAEPMNSRNCGQRRRMAVVDQISSSVSCQIGAAKVVSLLKEWESPCSGRSFCKASSAG
jgi:hypothetical protein